MSNSPRDHHGIDRAALLRVVEPVVHAHGAEVVDLELKPGRGGWILRVFVEKKGAAVQALSTREAAVSLELCANVSRDLSPALDVVDLIPYAYQLEVSSPGVERPLREEREFIRFKGHKAKLKRRADADGGEADEGGGRVIVGVLDGVADGKVRVIEGKRNLEVSLSSIESAHLVFEFGAPGRDTRDSRFQRRPEHRPAHGKSEHRKH